MHSSPSLNSSLMRLLEALLSITNLPRVRDIVFLLQKVRNVDSVRVVLLAEHEAGCSGKPRYVLAAVSDVDFVAALYEL